MNKSCIAAVHELELEAPIELAGLRRQRALKVNHELVQHRFVRPVVEKSPKILIIPGRSGIERNPAVDPPGNLKARFRSERSCLGFARYGRRSETKSKREIEKLSHGLAGTISAVRPVLGVGAGR